MDKVNIVLCQLLLANSRLSYRELADKLNISVTAVHKRIQSLIEMGIIRKFTAKISLSALKATQVIIFGESKLPLLYDLKTELAKNDSIYWLAVGSGNFVYVGAYLKNISELEPLMRHVRDVAELPEPTVGILSPEPYYAAQRVSDTALYDLDYQIIRSLKDNSRKAVAEIAEELGVSAKTVHRRLVRMIKNGLIELSIEWYPDASNDIITIFHIYLKPEFGEKVMNSIFKKYSPNMLFYWCFSNIPNFSLAFVWTSDMKELHGIRESLEREESVRSILPNVLFSGCIFETWRDKIL
jgi:DNA-binding Lrp family transcriptional regulator